MRRGTVTGARPGCADSGRTLRGTPAHAWEGGDNPQALEGWVNQKLKHADAAVARLLAVKGPRTVDNTLAVYDEAFSALLDAQSQAQVLYGVGATKELRDKAQALTQTASAALTALALNPAVYQALSAVATPADAGTRHYLEHTLLEYRLAGVDKDEATRAKIKVLQDKITERGLAFERTVHDDVRTISVEPSQLDGLPEDYLASHKPDAHGQVKITTDPPDAYPPLKFANNADLRHKLWLAAHSVGFPANTEILRGLLEAREQLAHLLGYGTWADYAMADQMIGSPAKLAEFLKKVDDASREPGAREDAALLRFVQQKDPSIKKISAADARYWQEQYRRATFNFDSQSVRPYFAYAAVERGVIDTASRLFHVQIKPVSACAPGTPRSPPTRCSMATRSWAPSTSTCTRARARTSGSRPSRSRPAYAGTSSPRARWCATSPAARPGIRDSCSTGTSSSSCTSSVTSCTT